MRITPLQELRIIYLALTAFHQPFVLFQVNEAPIKATNPQLKKLVTLGVKNQ